MPTLSRSADLRKLLSRCREGDRRAWDELVQHFQNLVYSIPRRMALSTDDCADVFQITFLALYRNLDRIDTPETLPKWLSTTASRESLKIKRLSQRTVQDKGDEGPSLDEIVASEDRSAEEMAVAATEGELVRLAMEKMPDRCRELLGLLYGSDEASYAEISEKMSMPVGAIGPTRARCMEKLRKILEGGGFF